jgi:hypothetical protein
MKKLIITIAIILGFGLTGFADGGLFNRGYNAKTRQSGFLYFNAKDPVSQGVATPLLPPHSSDEHESAPLGSGIALLMGFGAAYWMVEKRKKE